MPSAMSKYTEDALTWMKGHEYVVLAVIVFIGFVSRILIYLRYPYSYGIDGPYYNLQVESIMETGRLYKEDTPLAIYFFTLVSMLMGDVTMGIKVGSSILSSLIVVPAYYLTKRATRVWWAGYMAAFISLFNPLHVRMLDDFLKNIAGILLMLTFLHRFLKTCEDPSPLNHALSFSILALTFLTHIHPSSLCMLFTTGYIATLWIVERKPPRTELKVSAILFGSLALGFLAALALMPGAVSKFSKILSFVSTLDELEMEKLSIFGMRQLFYLFSIPTVIGFTYFIRDVSTDRGDGENMMLAGVYIVCFVLSMPIIPNAWRWRFTLANFLPAALQGGYGIGRISRDLPKMVFAGFLVVVMASSLLEAWEGSLHIGPRIDRAGVRELEEIREILPGNAVMVARGNFHYWVQLITGLRTFRGKIDPIQLHDEYGGPVLGIVDKGRTTPPIPPGKIVYDEGPFMVYRIYPK
jgi:hypothetical protein